jgi:energy-dependent translational throttle protein EttA
MQGLGKTYPGGKKVLENINLSFYPDAKIGVGVNGIAIPRPVAAKAS